MGRSNCKTKKVQAADNIAALLPDYVDPHDIERPTSELSSFFCDITTEPWITEKGWIELLQMFVTASSIPEGSDKTWEVLWLYVPDYIKAGQMAEIDKIPVKGQTYTTMEAPYFWEQSAKCSGFIVPSDCPWRSEEMTLVTFRPDACEKNFVDGCEELIAYARIVHTDEI